MAHHVVLIIFEQIRPLYPLSYREAVVFETEQPDHWGIEQKCVGCYWVAEFS